MATVLLVEDDPDQLDLRRELLEHAGHTVFPASSAAAAFYYLRVMVYMYFRDAEFDIEPSKPSATTLGTIVVLALLTLYFGLNPGMLMNLF